MAYEKRSTQKNWASQKYVTVLWVKLLFYELCESVIEEMDGAKKQGYLRDVIYEHPLTIAACK